MKFLKKSKYLLVEDGIIRMFIRWLYAKYLDELYIPKGTTVSLGHGIEKTGKHNGYGEYITISSTSTGGVRRGNQVVELRP